MPAIPAVIAAGAAVAGSAMSANAAKKSQKASDAANAKNTADTNAMNKQMFDESRGSTGHAFLPTYTGDAEKQSFEDLYNIYQSGKTPGQLRDETAALMAQMQPTVQAGTDYLKGVYSGENLAQARGYYQPLWDQRLQTAQAQADAIRQAYARQQQQNIATAMRGGFYGGSSVQSAEAQKNTLEALQQAALARGAARMQNAQEGAQLGISDLANRQALLNEPLTRVQSLANYNTLADQAAYGNYDQYANRLGTFKIGTSQPFQYQAAPVVQPGIGSGQITGSAISSLGQLGAQYAMNKLLNPSTPSGSTYNYNWQPTNTYQGNATPAASNAAAQAQAGSNAFWGG